MSEQTNTIRISQPTQLRIVAPNGDPLLTIYADGRWEFRDESAPTEAARVFFRELQRLTTAPDICGDRPNDELSCTRPAGHAGLHVDERVFGSVTTPAPAPAHPSEEADRG